MKKKRNPILVDTIMQAKKANNLELAKRLSMSTRKQISVNLGELNQIKEDKIVVVGRVLGGGEIKRKMTIYALGFSNQAKEKLKKSGCEIKTIKQAIGEKGVKIL